jgi:hypothetical protein
VATRLGLWNAALLEIGQERLSDTGDPVVSARELAFVHDKVVSECIAAGSWNFAMETIQADADTGVTPEFGYTKVFAKPSDWVRTVAISSDEYFSFPHLAYYDDSNFWSADSSPIYVRYVSDDTGLGLDLNRWTANFTRFVELELAERVCLKLTQSSSMKEDIGKRRDKARKRALNFDAMAEPNPKFPPPSGWTTSRWGRGGSSRDRGSRGSLTG